MKTKILVIVALFTAWSVRAQNISITAVDVPTNDAYIQYVEPQGLIPGLAGTNVTWAFTGLQTLKKDTIKWRNPAATPFVNQFSGATVVSNYATLYRHAYDLPTLVPHLPKDLFDLGYLEAGANGLYQMGNATKARMIILPATNDTLWLSEQISVSNPTPELVVPFPLEYGKTELGLHYRYVAKGVRTNGAGVYDSITIVRNIHKNFFADASGGLITPVRAYGNVVRLRTSIDGYDSLYVRNMLTNEHTAMRLSEYHPTVYSWFAQDLGAQKQWEVFRLTTTPNGAIEAFYKTDVQPLLNFTVPGVEVMQNAGVIKAEVRLSNPDYSRTINVRYTTEIQPITAEPGIDFLHSNGTLTFAPGDTLGYIPLTILEDSIMEDRKFFLLRINTPENADIGATDTYVIGINDSNRPSIRFSHKDTIFSELSDVAYVPVYMNYLLDSPVELYLSTEARTAQPGRDYVHFENRLFTLPAYTNKIFVPVQIIDNGFLEPARDFVLRINWVSPNAVLSYPDTIRVIISDDDFKPNLQLSKTDTTIYEATNGESNNLILNVRLSYPIVEPITVHYKLVPGTAQPSIDYVDVTEPLTFLPGETLKTFKVRILNNLKNQPNRRTFTIELANNTPNSQLGFMQKCLVTILDNDPIPTDTTQNPAISRDELKAKLNFALYPNPTQGILSTTMLEGLKGIAAYDINGRVLSLSYRNGVDNRLYIDLSGHPNGVYYLQFNTTSGDFTEKVVLTR